MKRLNVKDLKKDMIVYECEYGMNIKMCIKDDCTHTEEGYEAIGVTDKGEEIRLFQCKEEGFWHYGPKLYPTPEYYIIKDGKSVPNNI